MNSKISGFRGILLNGVIVPGRIKELTVFQTMEDGGEHHACDSDNCTLVPTATHDLVVAIAVMWEFLVANGSQSALHEQRLEVNASAADADSFLFARRLVIARSEACPGAKVLGGMEWRHVYTNFPEDGQSREFWSRFFSLEAKETSLK